MPKFKIYWKEGKIEEVEGEDIGDALSNAGYGYGALRALDHYDDVAATKDEAEAEHARRTADELGDLDKENDHGKQ